MEDWLTIEIVGDGKALFDAACIAVDVPTANRVVIRGDPRLPTKGEAALLYRAADRVSQAGAPVRITTTEHEASPTWILSPAISAHRDGFAAWYPLTTNSRSVSSFASRARRASSPDGMVA